jgi:alpha-ketoglutarate-dependent taurine dioxygenase
VAVGRFSFSVRSQVARITTPVWATSTAAMVAANTRNGRTLAPDQARAIPPGVSIIPQMIARVNAPWPRGRAPAHLQCGAALMPDILTVAEAARSAYSTTMSSSAASAISTVSARRAGENWHSDMCYTARPPRGTMLYALEIPELHGRTLGDKEFASAQAAWEALPDPIQYRIEGRRAVFDFTGRKRAFPPSQEEIDRNPPVMHPIVRTHPYTGKKCLYIMRDDCTGIEGLEGDEAEALITALADHIVKPAYVYRHQWRPGDLLMWDNCTVQHRAIQDYDLPQRRLMHRTTMGGSAPV